MEKERNIKELPIILIAGQTAVGKTEVAISLAKLINAEIISVDSMQVYKGMDVGTAKPTLEQRTDVPHHLIDILDVTESFDAAKFLNLANKSIEEIKSRNKNIIMCGGTGLYFKALLEGIGKGPAPDRNLRAELERLPLDVLLNELREKDPTTYNEIDKNNIRRVIRAVEVIRLSGKPYSSLKSKWDMRGSLHLENYHFFGLKREPGDLRQRINIRVDRMFEMGLVEETKRLIELGLEKNPTAMQAIGYRQVVEYLKGVRSLNETIELVKIRTWQYARRQMTWFKHQARLEWISLEKTADVNSVVSQLFMKILQR